MAGPGNETKFIATLLAIGCGVCAFFLLLQRRELKKYGYDLNVQKSQIELNNLHKVNLLGNYPAGSEKAKLLAILDKWKSEGSSTHQVYLRSAQNPPAAATIKQVPTLVKCANGDIYAYINVAGQQNVQQVGPFNQNMQPIVNGISRRWEDTYRNLDFPALNEKDPRRMVRNIENTAVVNDLIEYNQHVHISKQFAHADTRMDTRFLVLKNDRHTVLGPPPSGPILSEYYFYAQGKDGVYRLNKIDNPNELLRDINYKQIGFPDDQAVEIKRSGPCIERLATEYNIQYQQKRQIRENAVAAAAGRAAVAIPLEEMIKSNNPTFTPQQLRDIEAKSYQNVMLFGAMALAPAAPGMAKQAFGSASYALMNAAGAAIKKPGGIKNLLNGEAVQGFRNKYNLHRPGG